jgi:ferric-dicitrate binding protein FerR (iron transport regulator)
MSVRAASGVDVQLDGESLGELRFTGTVFNDKVPDWLAALPAIFPLTVRQEGTTYWVQEKH